MIKRENYYALALLLGIVWGDAGHWLITPHPDASVTRVVLVWLQLLIGLATFVWALWKGRRGSAPGGVNDVASA